MTNQQGSSENKNAVGNGSKIDWLTQIIAFIKTPIFIGLVITLVFAFFSKKYYFFKNQNDSARTPNFFLDLVETIDLKTMDMRFRWRGEKPSQAPVALLTIDDRSLEEIGRWPWSREKIAYVTDRMMSFGAKAIGFDIIFSEPQTDASLTTLTKLEGQGPLPPQIKEFIEAEKQKSQPDLILAQTFAKYKDKLVLGTFNEDSLGAHSAYQDYCRNEAFKRANADKFVKLNSTFIVNDEADLFVDLDFEKILALIFSDLEKNNQANLLKEKFENATFEKLAPAEVKNLKYLVEDRTMKYCDTWLSDADPYREASKDVYLKIFASSPHLKGLGFTEAIEKFKSLVKSHPVVQNRRWTINTDQIQEAIDYTASFNAEQDGDGTIRRASMFFRTGNKIGTSFVPSLSLQTYLIATGHQAQIEINIDPKNPEQKIISKFEIVDMSKEPKDPQYKVADIPVDGQGRLKINYYGGRSMLPYLPVKELFNDKKTATIEQMVWDSSNRRYISVFKEVDKASFIKDKTFIFGATAIGIYDLRVTPFEKNYPGPETHLTSLANLFEHNFIRTNPQEPQIMFWSLLLFGLLLSIAVSQAGAIAGFAMTSATLLGVIFFDSWLFKNGTTTSMFLVFFLALFLYTFLTFYKYFTEERKKRHLKSTFSKYVSPAIVDEILKHPENIELGGKKTRMSVFFSDVRGFTTISEKLEPQVLSDVLSRYLSPMTEIVFKNKGTLDKYMGDALMAFFGAPVAFPDHAKFACRTALEQLQKLAEIQKEFAAQGYPPIDIGIGINTGDMSVGNMGSNIVRNYTVMGDAVNLGSRLEGINKEYGTKVIISEFTYSEIKNDFTAREVDWVRVKGKNEPVRIFELICEGPPPPDRKETLELFKQGFDLYHQRKFAEAKELFVKALEKSPTDKPDEPSELYVERCSEYIADTPGADWDGVYVMKTK